MPAQVHRPLVDVHKNTLLTVTKPVLHACLKLSPGGAIITVVDQPSEWNVSQ